MINDYTKRKEEIQIKNLSMSSADCNDYINTGIYYLGSNLSNAPQDYIKLIVLGANKSVSIGDVFQIAGGVSNGKMYCRNGNFKASEGKIVWGQWRCLTQNISTGTEYETGRIIDGKKEYGKRINCGKLPDTSTTSIATNLGNVNILDYKGTAIFNQYSYKMVVGKISDYSISLAIENNQIKITTYLSAYKNYNAYVEIFYTKN